ncbi:MAG: hypothetical protein AABZ32_11170 [Bacteroidota bacterium]
MKPFYFLSVLCIILIFSCQPSQDENTTDTPMPSGNCIYTRDEKDPLGKRIRVVQDEKFISLEFTDSAAKAFYKGEEFFKGYLSCVSVDTVLGIYFDFKIHTDDAFQYYGMLKKDNKITLMLKSGRAVELSFGSTFSGNTNLTNEFTEYSSFAHLSKSNAERLMSEDLQRVRISWSKKDEEYVVVNPKIFINQIPCVE